MATRLLAGLQAENTLTSRWANAPHAWIKSLLPAVKGRIGEKLASDLLADAGLDVGPRTGPGHDRRVAGVPVEIKLSTSYDTADPAAATCKWLQLRPGDDYELVLLVGVCPDHVHVWAVNKDDTLEHATGQHTGAGAVETRQLEAFPDRAPAWFGPDLAAGGDVLVARLVELGVPVGA